MWGRTFKFIRKDYTKKVFKIHEAIDGKEEKKDTLLIRFFDLN